MLLSAGAANICILQSRQDNQGDIWDCIQHNMNKISIIREIFKFVLQSIERLVYFQGTFCRIEDSWQLCFACNFIANIIDTVTDSPRPITFCWCPRRLMHMYTPILTWSLIHKIQSSIYLQRTWVVICLSLLFYRQTWSLINAWCVGK